ncbi:MAG: FecR domain-containing protein [Cytophagales bacterium]|nr:FecR domain-containing protein [Cytophagales bacterium]
MNLHLRAASELRYLLIKIGLMTKEEYIQLADKYRHNRCSKEEKELFERILDNFQVNQKDFEWDLSDQQKTNKKIKSVVLDKIGTDVPIKAGKSFVARFIRIAASIVLISGLTYLFYVNNNNTQSAPVPVLVTKTTEHDQRSTITLSDGTVVHLNTGSSIRFEETFSGDKRLLELSGEAFFEVARNELIPFEVISGPVRTVVLGTSFNVNARQKNITVAVSSGEVAVSSMIGMPNEAQDRRTILRAREKVVYDHQKNTLSKSEADLQLDLAWKNPEINFDNTPLSYASVILSARYNKEIVIRDPAIKNCRITNRYMEESLTNILDGLEFIIDVKYEVNEKNQIVLYGIGCDD